MNTFNVNPVGARRWSGDLKVENLLPEMTPADVDATNKVQALNAYLRQRFGKRQFVVTGNHQSGRYTALDRVSDLSTLFQVSKKED